MLATNAPLDTVPAPGILPSRMSDALTKLDPSKARQWEPVSRSPREIWLRCEGGMLARLVSCLHFLWPFTRGHWRFVNAISRMQPIAKRLEGVVFRSSCGVPVHLDVPTVQFLYLSGRLSTEPLELAVISRIVRQGDVFVDVGAHWGLYIPHVLGRLGTDGSYIAIEPSEANCSFLARAFGRLDPRLQILRLAISSDQGHAYLHRDGTSEAFISSSADGGIPVTVQRLDAVLGNSLRGRTAVIKIDTEGQEAAVIRGCSELVQGGVKPILLLEFLSAIHGQTRGQVVDAIFSTFGTDFSLWAISPSRGTLVRFEAVGDVGTDVRNILAIPPGELHRLKLVTG